MGFLLRYVKKSSQTNEWTRILRSSKNFIGSLREALYCESYKGKKAVADVRAGIKYPTWSFEDQLGKNEWKNDKGMIF